MQRRKTETDREIGGEGETERGEREHIHRMGGDKYVTLGQL